MKKIIAMMLSLIMLLSGIGVNGESLDFLKNPMTNYTQEGTFSFKITNVDEIINFFTGGMDGIEELTENDFADFGLLFQTLLAFDGNMNAKYSVSDDYKNIKMSLDMGCNYNVEVNDKLSLLLKAGAEAWIEIDVSDLQDPSCKFIISTPFSKKYMYVDLFELIGSEDDSQKLALLLVLTHFTDKEFVGEMNSFSVKCVEEYADVTEKDGTYTIKFDNDAMLKYICSVANYMYGDIASVFSVVTEENEVQALFPENPNLKILGDDGITLTYKTKNGTLESSSCTGDISVSLKDVFELLDIEYQFYKDLCIEAELSAEYTCSDIGTTKVDIPVVNEKNGISLTDLFSNRNEEVDMGDFEYPSYYLYIGYDAYSDDDEIYIPFALLMDEAFGNNVTVSISDNSVLSESTYFGEFTKLEFNIGETTACIDGKQIDAGKTKKVEDEVLVSKAFVENVFGWNVESLEHDLINNKNFVWILTESEEEDAEDGFYVSDYVYVGSNYMPDNGEIYVPLRDVLENAYGEAVTLSYENGAITARSELFPSFETVKMKIGENVVYIDEQPIEVGEIILNEEITYVPAKLFTDNFGWFLETANYEVISGLYSIGFMTSNA